LYRDGTQLRVILKKNQRKPTLVARTASVRNHTGMLCREAKTVQNY
ncbi:unnamed protein product, partial [Ectocarpus fasciculatus]